MTSAGHLGGPVRGERTADVVARRLGQAILSGEIAPGTRLREETLAKQFLVSRTPVREALIALSASGLVEVEPNRGSTVLRLTADDVAEVYHLRALLESESAALAASRGTPEVAELLAKTCDRMAELHGAPASEQLAADTFFHYSIAEASGSPRFARRLGRPAGRRAPRVRSGGRAAAVISPAGRTLGQVPLRRPRT